MSQALHTFVQLSDLHVNAAGPLYGKVDTPARLRAALDLVEAMDAAPEAVLVSGDLTNDAQPDDYRAARAVLGPVLDRLGVPLVVIPGNHDDPALLREHLIGQAPGAGTMDSVTWLGGTRLVAVDSSLAGEDRGQVSDAQLGWLTAELATPAPEGTVLAIHHPPLRSSPVGLFDHIGLERPEALAEVLRGSDVRMVLCGHAHHVGAGAVAGIPVWIAPSLAYAADVTAPHEQFRGLAFGGITRVDVFPGEVLATLIPLEGREVIVELAVDDIITKH